MKYIAAVVNRLKCNSIIRVVTCVSWKKRILSKLILSDGVFGCRFSSVNLPLEKRFGLFLRFWVFRSWSKRLLPDSQNIKSRTASSYSIELGSEGCFASSSCHTTHLCDVTKGTQASLKVNDAPSQTDKWRKTQHPQQTANSGLAMMFSGGHEFVSFWIASHADVEIRRNEIHK